MPPDRLEPVALHLLCGVKLLAVATLLFGAFSAAAPRQSIELYQWLMARFNWRVSPIDERREVLTTRALGILLVLFSLVALWLLFVKRT